ncbi:MAG: EAL domain-containing protein [Erythrobacter sp.]|nr:EAL domain-containing protein [Erythrobacter sp.]
MSDEPLSPAPAISRFERIESGSIDRILGAVRKHLGVDIAFVSRFLDNGERELTHVDSDLELPMGPGFREPRENSYCWHIAKGDLPQLIQNPKDHALTQTLAITDLLPVGCHLNVPLTLSDGTLYGSFCCLSRQPDRSMNERDLGVLKAFAALAVEQIEGSLEDSARSSAIEDTVREFLASGDLRILHQPIVSMASFEPVGVECLARFPDAEERGPDAWFNEAAEIGLGVELETFAIRSALATVHHIPKSAYLSVNASPETILAGKLEKILKPFASRNLVLEVTEHHRVSDFDGLKECLQRVAPFARIAIDDVGAGYAGLRHLVDLEPDLLKLDMSLTRDIHKDVARQALTTAMVQFASEIGAKLVAEGVECAEERDQLAKLGVDYGQGYFFARPMPIVASAQFMIGAGQD